MAEPQPQPVLVRDDAIVATAVGVPDPSLTLVEFERGVGFLLTCGFYAASFPARYYLEQVILWRTGDLGSEPESHRLVVLGEGSGRTDTGAVTAAELGITSAHWPPAVFFLSEGERTRLLVRLEEHDPEHVLREAFNRAHRTEELRSRVLKLKARWEKELRGCHILEARVQPKEATVRISLPPKPAGKDTVRLELPPRPANLKSKEQTELERRLKQQQPPGDPPPKP